MRRRKLNGQKGRKTASSDELPINCRSLDPACLDARPYRLEFGPDSERKYAMLVIACAQRHTQCRLLSASE